MKRILRFFIFIPICFILSQTNAMDPVLQKAMEDVIKAAKEVSKAAAVNPAWSNIAEEARNTVKEFQEFKKLGLISNALLAPGGYFKELNLPSEL